MASSVSMKRPLQVYRTIFFVFVFALFAYLTKSFLAPLLLAGVFASVLYPTFQYLLDKKLSRGLAATLTTIIFSVCFLIPIIAIIFSGANTALEQIQSIEKKVEESAAKTQSVDDLVNALSLSKPMTYLDKWLPGDRAEFRKILSKGLEEGGRLLVEGLKIVLERIPRTLLSAFVTVFALFYFLVDGERILNWFEKKSFFSDTNTKTLIATINKACSSAIYASIMTGLIQTVLMVIACLITSVPGLLLISLLTFVSSLIPVVGTTPVVIGIVLYHVANAQYVSILVFVGLAVLIGVSDNVARPYFIKSGAEIHPLAAFVFTFGAVSVMGFYGIFLGPVAAGIFLGVLRMPPPK